MQVDCMKRDAKRVWEDEAAAKEQVVQELPSLIIILLLSSVLILMLIIRYICLFVETGTIFSWHQKHTRKATLQPTWAG